MQVDPFHTHLKWPGTFQGARSLIMLPVPASRLNSLSAACLTESAFIATATELSQFVFSGNFSLLFCLLSFVSLALLCYHYQKVNHTFDWQSNNFGMLDVIFVFDFVLAASLLIAKFILYRQEFAFFPTSDLHSGY